MTASYPSLATHSRYDTCCPALWDALRDIMDPEMPLSIVDMGLVVSISCRNSVVGLKVTFTAMGCPAMEMILDDIEQRLLREPDIQKVNIEVVWEPVWTSARLTEDGVFTLRTWGVSA